MIIEASFFDKDLIRAIAGTTGKVHSIYRSAITLDFSDTMVTILPEKRGEGPGFILISPESDFPDRSLLKPGDKVSIDKNCSRMNTGELEIVLGNAKGFSSIFIPFPDGPEAVSTGDLTSVPLSRVESRKNENNDEDFDLRQLVKIIGEYFLKSENLGNSLLSRVVPELQGINLKCSIGSCVLSVWKETVDNILLDLKNSIKKRDEELFGGTLKRLVGMGWGLTPGGDDFILGMLGFTSLVLNNEAENDINAEDDSIKKHKADRYETFSFVNMQIRNHLPGLIYKTGYVSGAYLRYAIEGRYVNSFIGFIKSLMKNDRRVLEKSLEVLTAHGATSGMDMAAGVIFLLWTSASVISPDI